jgi:hypothetical protein
MREVRWDRGGTVRAGDYYSGDQFEKNEMGGAVSAYGAEERCI